MRIYKFGGASVKSADAVKNVAQIIQSTHNLNSEPLLVVVSAMGKTTNALEAILNDYYKNNALCTSQIDALIDFHRTIVKELFQTNDESITEKIEYFSDFLHRTTATTNTLTYNELYDKIVSIGELLSTFIVSEYLNQIGINNQWADARNLIKTTDSFREGKVLLNESVEKIQEFINQAHHNLTVTQGFIGSTTQCRTTTLGREGSDYSGALFAYATQAKDYTIWKDVPGMLNADPKWFSKTTLLKNISYKEAIELAYYGATIIHPRTIQPLQHKSIPLYVKSFVNPSLEGTVINSNASYDASVPSYIFKINQVLISISSKDLSFVAEDNISSIYSIFAAHNVKINTMQNSAVSLSVSVSADDSKIPALIQELQKDYSVKYNEGLELLTIRHYTPETIAYLIENKTVLLEQKTRTTARYLMRP